MPARVNRGGYIQPARGKRCSQSSRICNQGIGLTNVQLNAELIESGSRARQCHEITGAVYDDRAIAADRCKLIGMMKSDVQCPIAAQRDAANRAASRIGTEVELLAHSRQQIIENKGAVIASRLVVATGQDDDKRRRAIRNERICDRLNPQIDPVCFIGVATMQEINNRQLLCSRLITRR